VTTFEIILSVVAFAVIAVLVVPFHFEIDTRRKGGAVGWLFLTAGMERRERVLWFRVAGLSIRKRLRSEREPEFSAPSEFTTSYGSSKGRQLLHGLALHPALAIDLLKKLVRYLLSVLRSFRIAFLEGEASFSDPVLNGVCYGIVQGIEIPKTRIGVNFNEENWLIGRFNLRLFRLILPTARLVATLPYHGLWGLIREAFRRKAEGGGRGPSSDESPRVAG
jgi:hypothetical protein